MSGGRSAPASARRHHRCRSLPSRARGLRSRLRPCRAATWRGGSNPARAAMAPSRAGYRQPTISAGLAALAEAPALRALGAAAAPTRCAETTRGSPARARMVARVARRNRPVGPAPPARQAARRTRGNEPRFLKRASSAGAATEERWARAAESRPARAKGKISCHLLLDWYQALETWSHDKSRFNGADESLARTRKPNRKDGHNDLDDTASQRHSTKVAFCVAKGASASPRESGPTGHIKE